MWEYGSGCNCLLQILTLILPSAQNSDLFKLVNSEGAEIKGEELGLLLYNGGTVCNRNDRYIPYNNFDFMIADAICKEMNFTRAKRWTTDERFDIQSNYSISLGYVYCRSSDSWKYNCSIDLETKYCNWHNDDVFLSCTGKCYRCSA